MQEDNTRVEENVVDGNADYVAAIKELKQNSVPKEKYEALALEKKQLLDALVSGQEVEVETEEPTDISALRNDLFNNENLTNLEYVTKTLELRNALLEKGEEDPFLPHGSMISPTQADYDKAERVATVLQEMVDVSDGDPNVFLNEFQRRVKETNIPKR